ncbi:carboxymuconolactone decarboxylase family protein [Chitinasiproducens palmae]|uniref:Uncharacterized peroxidase-related enzyme n=1 Tax=Chitinasiproducens palmae TaxID=1770053 RepID=A0A1H2PN52_9BURK|nr:carboxymuconolactone decarboxylase family protein [Chitinasiproducens palmae]SDV48053.1 uncharacterized peroxidase-related enzyme [Chitinasiproducens palmae]
MSRLPLVDANSAPAASKPLVEQVQRNNGFLPNLVATLANAPAALEAYLTVGEINSRSGLTLAEREAVQITAAGIHGCGFCVAGHSKIATLKAQLDAPVVTALRDGTAVPDARLEAVAVFTRAVIAHRGAVPDDALAAFRAAGFSDANALEVVLGVSLATLCNFANNLAGNDLNPELASFAWHGLAAAQA